jgi:acetylornithine deacetylase/succinyl-diaminopimelate desuccinylase-like protein
MPQLVDIDHAIDERAEAAFAFLERLIAQESVSGHESRAQEVVAERLSSLGLQVTELPIPDSIVDHQGAGVPPRPYADGSTCWDAQAQRRGVRCC